MLYTRERDREGEKQRAYWVLCTIREKFFLVRTFCLINWIFSIVSMYQNKHFFFYLLIIIDVVTIGCLINPPLLCPMNTFPFPTFFIFLLFLVSFFVFFFFFLFFFFFCFTKGTKSMSMDPSSSDFFLPTFQNLLSPPCPVTIISSPFHKIPGL